jgi:hypothetical protein
MYEPILTPLDSLLFVDLGPKGISARFNDRERDDRRGGDRDRDRRPPYDDYNSGPPRGRRSNSRDRDRDRDRRPVGGYGGGRSRSRERFVSYSLLLFPHGVHLSQTL